MKVYRNRVLEFEHRNVVEHYLIPYDLSVKKYQIRKVLEDSIILEDINRDKNDFYREIILYKRPFAKEFIFKKENFRISLVYENSSFRKAVKILFEEHYISNIPKGLYFVLEDRNDVVGVVVLSKLVYTNPVGRKIFLKDEFRSDDQIKAFGLRQIAWISRIAISKSSQARGIGSLFISKLPTLIFQIFPNNKLEYIEILTSWTLEKLKILNIANADETDLRNVSLPNDKDFLCKKSTSYERIELPNRVKYTVQKRKTIDKLGNVSVQRTQVMKFYYVKKLK
jgi:hypothetical protein